jgi:hypothetical protein
MQLFDKFRNLAVCTPSKGDTVLFWSNNRSGNILRGQFPQLFSFTKKQKCSIKYFLDQELKRIFSLPLSTQAAAQLEEVEVLLQLSSWDENIDDKWCYTWGSSNFRSKKAYTSLIGHTPCSPLFTWLWSSSNLGKHKFFFCPTEG